MKDITPNPIMYHLVELIVHLDTSQMTLIKYVANAQNLAQFVTGQVKIIELSVLMINCKCLVLGSENDAKAMQQFPKAVHQVERYCALTNESLVMVRQRMIVLAVTLDFTSSQISLQEKLAGLIAQQDSGRHRSGYDSNAHRNVKLEAVNQTKIA